jgi:hypothetical protein
LPAVTKYISSGWCMAVSALCTYPITLLWPNVHVQIFPPQQSKLLACTRPALNLMRLSITVNQQVYFAFLMYDKCTNCNFVSETFYRKGPRLNYLTFLCPYDFTSYKPNFIIHWDEFHSKRIK